MLSVLSLLLKSPRTEITAVRNLLPAPTYSPPWVWSLGAEMDLWTSPGWPIPWDPCAVVFNPGAIEFMLEKPSKITESICYPSTANSITKLCPWVLQFPRNAQMAVDKSTKRGEMTYFGTALHALIFWGLRKPHGLPWKCSYPELCASLRSQKLFPLPSG